MIEKWNKFNESSEDEYKKEYLLEVYNKIREYMYEFEDLGILSYSFDLGKEFNNKSSSYKSILNTDKNISNENLDMFVKTSADNLLKSFNKSLEKIFLICDIKLTNFCEYGSLNKKGIELLEEIMVTYNRINDTYPCLLDLNKFGTTEKIVLDIRIK